MDDVQLCQLGGGAAGSGYKAFALLFVKDVLKNGVGGGV